MKSMALCEEKHTTNSKSTKRPFASGFMWKRHLMVLPSSRCFGVMFPGGLILKNSENMGDAEERVAECRFHVSPVGARMKTSAPRK